MFFTISDTKLNEDLMMSMCLNKTFLQKIRMILDYKRNVLKYTKKFRCNVNLFTSLDNYL